MKKLVILVLLAALVVPFVLSGCSSQSPTSTTPTITPTTTPTYSDSGVIKANVNEEFVIALDSNPSTGYSWQENHDQSFLTLVDKKFEQSPGSEGKPGAGGTEYFRFKALKTGEAKVTLGYSRSWESQPPLDTREFTIDIK